MAFVVGAANLWQARIYQTRPEAVKENRLTAGDFVCTMSTSGVSEFLLDTLGAVWHKRLGGFLGCARWCRLGAVLGGREPLERFLREWQVLELVGNVSRVTLWRWVRIGTFPAPAWLGPNTKAWPESDLRKWQQARLAQRDPKARRTDREAA